jgi:ABC-type multidrug transport system fused ATPase/permease subunit
LPARDLTSRGERGINLSSRYKVRICLARTACANRDIILMDDPISALDSTIRK